MPTPIAIACDAAGFDLKTDLKAHLGTERWTIADLGCPDKEVVHYPLYAQAMAREIQAGRARFGILICGSGIGISIAANRSRYLRAALVRDPLEARLAREHNDANVICLGGQLIGSWAARECVDVFLATPFGQGRHVPRVEMLGAMGGE